MNTISVDYWYGQAFGGVFIDKPPEECAACHYSIQAVYKFGVIANNWAPGNSRDNYVQAVYVCPRADCRQIFIAYYTQFNTGRDYKGQAEPPYKLQDIKPRSFKAKEFPAIIKEVSPSFCAIYNEATQAEHLKLSNIAGPGYRKALEFLVKDFLISEHPADKDVIEKTLLGTLIKQKIPDGNLNQCLERAAWIGNDETHYRRTWIDKDIRDLKQLIRLCVIWMESHLLTKQYLKDMPPR
jgi:hypothetical protein